MIYPQNFNFCFTYFHFSTPSDLKMASVEEICQHFKALFPFLLGYTKRVCRQPLATKMKRCDSFKKFYNHFTTLFKCNEERFCQTFARFYAAPRPIFHLSPKKVFSISVRIWIYFTAIHVFLDDVNDIDFIRRDQLYLFQKCFVIYIFKHKIVDWSQKLAVSPGLDLKIY